MMGQAHKDASYLHLLEDASKIHLMGNFNLNPRVVPDCAVGVSLCWSVAASQPA